MISILVSSLLALAVATSFTQQIVTIATQDLRSQASEDGRNAFSIISHLLQHATTNTIDITDTTTTVTVDFLLPTGISVWPNTTGPAYNKNAVRVQWDKTGADAFKIKINNQPTLAVLNNNSLTTLVGSNAGTNTRVSNFSLSSVPGVGFLLSLTTTAGFNQALIGETFEAVIIPRN